MWPKSNIPTIILPPNHYPQVGRPPNKRKKSAGEDIPMVRNNKLSMRSQTVTCVLCHTKGHNRRSCKGHDVPKGNKTDALRGRGASASIGVAIKRKKIGTASGSKEAAQKGKKTDAHKGSANVKGSAS
ncbi:hypothetical protein Tco_0915832 [Tanacetum coccineum]